MIPGTRPQINYILCLFMVAGCLLPDSRGHSQDLSFLSDTTRYTWPTDASRYISSTFGETRSAHFHAGLDIRTWGREGYRVFATRDGVVYRLGIGPSGYGKVIFLKHDDASFSIYAHLNRFEESLMEIADSIRMDDYRFILDRNMEDRGIRVKQGDLIGYTGSTGIGPPHLHFELRTPDDHPFNPLLTNLEVEDDLPPVFTDLAVEHLDPETFHIYRQETRSVSQRGNHVDFGTVHANGPVGLAVNVHDRANRTPNKYAVYELALTERQDTLFYSRIDAYDYKDATQLLVDRVYSLLKQERQGYQRLYIVNGNQLPFYKTGETRGILDLAEGEYDYTITAMDFYGNRTTGSVKLNITDRNIPPSERITGIPAYPERIYAGEPEMPRSSRNSPNVAAGTPDVKNRAGGGPFPDEHIAPSPVRFPARSITGQMEKILIPGKRQFLDFPDQTAWIEFPEDALFDTLHVEMELDRQGKYPVIRFNPDNVPLKNPAWLNIIMPQAVRETESPGMRNNETPGVYSYDRQRNSYRFRGTGQPGTLLRIRIFELQELQFLEDSVPPWMGRPVLNRNLGGVPVINVPVADEMAGIDFHRSDIIVNGEPGIIEYDPDKSRLIYYNPNFTPLSVNKVDVRVYDRQGNRSARVFESVR